MSLTRGGRNNLSHLSIIDVLRNGPLGSRYHAAISPNGLGDGAGKSVRLELAGGLGGLEAALGLRIGRAEFGARRHRGAEAGLEDLPNLLQRHLVDLLAAQRLQEMLALIERQF